MKHQQNFYSALNGKLCYASAYSFKFNRNMRDIEHAVSFYSHYAEQTLRILFAKHVIQASTASSHRVGTCIFEPSKQSRIRKSSFWSHRRSTVQWETALSSKERSRRVNCPMLVPYNFVNKQTYHNWSTHEHPCFKFSIILFIEAVTSCNGWV